MIVKICGITNSEDARRCVQAGADWIGLNLVAGPRRIEPAAAGTIVAGLGDPSRVVVLIEWGKEGADHQSIGPLCEWGVRRVQVYGHVTPEALETLHGQGFETILVRQLGDERSVDDAERFLLRCRTRPDYVLFDAADVDRLGGTGRRANWEALSAARSSGRLAGWPPVVLAGGLTAENVAEGVRATSPAGVDVSSGVESSPGRKDADKVRRFIEQSRGVR